MFTGLIEHQGRITAISPLDTTESGGGGWSITIGDSAAILGDCHVGDSICTNSACLTVTEFNADPSDNGGWFKVGVAPETLDKTDLADYLECFVRVWGINRTRTEHSNVGTASLVGDFIATPPPGTIAASVDVEAAFRTIPIMPSQWKYIVVRVGDGFLIDKCLPFGIATAVGVHGETVDALADILRWMRFSEVFKWVEDTALWQTPVSSATSADGAISYSYEHPNLEPIFHLARFLGIPLHPDKVQQFGTRITYFGFDWDIANKTVSLPEKKRLKYLNKVTSFLETYAPHGRKLHLKSLESVHGSLMHRTFVISEGRSYLNATHRFMHTFEGSHRSARFLAASAVDELKWWKGELSKPEWYRSLQPLPLDDSFKIYVDASSSWGISLVFTASDGTVHWDGWRGRAGWLNDSDRTINWAEEVGLELAVLAAVELGLSGRRVVIWGDNNVAIGALRKGAPSNIPMNLSIRRTLVVQASNNIIPEPLYVATEENLADGASRGAPAAGHLRYRFQFQPPSQLYYPC